MTDHPVPLHHFPEELLLDHAAGTLPEGLALVVATHAALCPACRRRLAEAEALGGALLAAIEPVALAPDALDCVLARIDAEGGKAAAAAAPPQRDLLLPLPLHDYVGRDVEALPWRRLLPGVEAAPLRSSGGGEMAARLLRITPGRGVPRHTHRGLEATLVLAGGYDDAGGHYERGDVQLGDPALDHRPVAASGAACLCLVYEEAPIRLTGPVGRWFNGLVRG